MPLCLISLGSNVGSRAETLRNALRALDCSGTVDCSGMLDGSGPETDCDRQRHGAGRAATLAPLRLLARSAWYATEPVGGPPGQGPFLNAAALVETSLDPPQLVARLLEIERAAGRTRHVRWDARPLDLDLLLYDRQQISEAGIETPHPRMNCRRFVLDPAAEIAPYMVHPACGWTVGALARQLREGRQLAWIAAPDPARAERVAERLRQQCGWQIDVVGQGAASDPAAIAVRNPRLLLACPTDDPCEARADAGGRGDAFRRRMRELSARWPVVWLSPSWDQCIAEAEAAVIAAGP